MKTEIWGHRGTSAYAPENTLESFSLAADMGADGVELDIQLTRDGEVVVIHDETLSRTSNGEGYVKDYTLAELKKLNFGRNKAAETKFAQLSTQQPAQTPTQIPTLDEVLVLLSPTSLKINIELKTGVFEYNGIEEKAVNIVRRHGLMGRIIWSSFNLRSVQKIKEIEPLAKTAALCGASVFITPRECAAFAVNALHCDINQMRYPNLAQECREYGIKLRIYTVNTLRDFIYAQKIGASAVITNYPDIKGTVKKLNDIQAVELNILKEFSSVAKAENLTWFAMLGTLLGAVRHKGFIPWDSDIDIAMPRADYERLKAKPDLFAEPFFLQTPTNDPAAAPRFLNLKRSDTALIYPGSINGFTRGGNMGIHIDIFPLDTMPDIYCACGVQNAANTVFKQMYASAALDENEGEAVPDFKEDFCFANGGIAGFYNFFAERYNKVCSRYTEGQYYAMPVLSGGRGNRLYDKAWFSESLEMDFEDIKVPVPAKWNEVLIASYPEGLYEPDLKYRKAELPDNCIVDPLRSYKDYMSRYFNMLEDIEGKDVYIFGAGDSLRIWLERYSAGLNVVCAFDNSKAKWGTISYGKKVRCPDELPGLLNENSRVIIASVYHPEISKQLERMGIKDYYIFLDGLRYRRAANVGNANG
jgi:lipopolysaccharide cholinephosphotransferase